MTDTHATAHIPDEAVEAALEAMNPMKSPSECCLYDVKKGLTAALPHLSAPCAVEVVKLDWQEPTKETNGCWTAKCLIGTYSVVNENGWYAVLDEHAWGVEGFEWSSTDLSKDTRQTAFAAAQADFERRILSRVVTKPVDVAAVWNDAVEQSAVIADSCVHLTPDVGNAVRNLKVRALSAEPAQGDRWQPIEPKLDGTEYLTWNGRRYPVAKFDKVENEWVSSFTTVTKRLPISPKPCVFMPLPAAPTPEAGK